MVYFVQELLGLNSRMAWIVEIQSGTPLITLQVRKGLPLTRKNRRLLDGKSRVTLSSLKEEMTWDALGLGLFNVEIVRSEMKVW